MHRCAPVEAVRLLGVGGDGANPPLFARSQVYPIGAPALRVGVDVARIDRVGHRIEPVTVRNVEHIRVRDPHAIVRAHRDAPCPVVLCAAVHEVRVATIHIDIVELCDGKIVDKVPVPGAIVREVQPTIVAQHHVITVGRVEPERVMIDVNSIAGTVGGEGLSAIDRLVQVRRRHPDLVGMLRVNANLRVVHGARVERDRAPPRRPPIV